MARQRPKCDVEDAMDGKWPVRTQIQSVLSYQAF